MSQSNDKTPSTEAGQPTPQTIRRVFYLVNAIVFSCLHAWTTDEGYHPLLWFISNPFGWWGFNAGVFSVLIWFGVYWIVRSLRGVPTRSGILLSFMGLGLASFGTLVLTEGKYAWAFSIPAVISVIEFAMIGMVKKEHLSKDARIARTRNIVWWIRAIPYASLTVLLHCIPLAGGHGVAPLVFLMFLPMNPVFMVLAWIGDVFLIRNLFGGLTPKSISNGLIGLTLWYLALLTINHEAFNFTTAQILRISIIPAGFVLFDLLLLYALETEVIPSPSQKQESPPQN